MGMGNKPGVRHYFAEGITNRGYISLLPNMMSEWERTYVLMGGPGTGKSTLIKLIGLDLLDRGNEIDFLRSARDPDSIAGMLIRRANIAILDAYEIAPQRWRAPGVVERFIDFSAYCDLRKLDTQRQSILDLERQINQLEQQMGEILAEEFGEKIREKPYLNFENGEVGKPWIRTLSASGIFKEAQGPWPKAQDALRKLQKSAVNSFFLHGMDCEGWLNLAPNYLMEYDQIRLDGAETSEAMDWVLREAGQLGQVIDIVLHPLYPDEIIGIVFPERKLAIWQGAPDHLEDQGLICRFDEKLKEVLVKTQNARDRIKSIYMDVIDFEQVDKLKVELVHSIIREIDLGKK
jgi:hypothetical protein